MDYLLQPSSARKSGSHQAGTARMIQPQIVLFVRWGRSAHVECEQHQGRASRAQVTLLAVCASTRQLLHPAWLCTPCFLG